jgi:probable HAF family extracellular repeat protein
VITVLNVPAANTQTSLGTFAEGINDEGEVVGYFDDSLGHTHGFIESGGVYTTFDAPLSNAGATKAFGINDAGDVVGLDDFTESEFINGMVVAGSTITNGFFATPLAAAAPEPSTWAMLLIGFAGLSLAGRRASRRVHPLAG